MKRWILTVVVGSVVLSALVNAWTIKDGHNWGDDFAQYIINARNIIEGAPYGSGIMLDNPTYSAPGFSMLLVPFLMVFDLDFKALKLPNLVWWYLSVALLYGVFLKEGGRRLALAGVVFLACSSFFFVYKQNILSDLPFFFFVCLSLYLCDRRFVLFLLAVSFALWIRPVGALLFLAAALYFMAIRRDPRLAVATALVFILNELVLLSVFGIHQGGNQAIQDILVLLSSVARNFDVTFKSAWHLFFPVQTIFSAALFRAVDPMFIFIAPALFLWLSYLFALGLAQRNISFLGIFSFFYLIALIVWSGVPTPAEGFARYVLPLIPFVFIHLHKSIQGWGRSALRVIFLFLLGINLSNIIIGWNFNDDAIGLPQQKQMISWVKDNTRETDRLMFWKPRAMALLTGREGTAPWIGLDQRASFIQRIKEFRISYVILLKRQDQGLIAQLMGGKGFDLAWENDTYQIFRSWEEYAS